MFEFYKKNQDKLSNQSDFKMFIEECCNQQAKTILFTKPTADSENVEKNERKNSALEFRSSLKSSFDRIDKMYLPKYNPLQELENMQLNK